MEPTGVFSVESAGSQLDALHEKFRNQKGATIAILQEVQETFGYVPMEAIGWLSDRLEIPECHFFGVATFYSQFHMKPRGKNVITACTGTACHVKGSDKIVTAIRRELGLGEGEDTTQDLEFTLETLNCVGACSLAPVVIINKKYHGTSSSDKILKVLKPMMKKCGGCDEP